MNSDQNDYIPVRDGQIDQHTFSPQVLNEINVNKPERSSKIESVLSRFRSGVERVYSESKERSLSRMKENEGEMQQKFSITTVNNNDTSELNKIGQENITRFLDDKNQQVLEEASKVDCYVIREQLRSSQNREEEEERIYREQIDKLTKKNQELEQQIQRKKRMQTQSINVSSAAKITVENIAKNATPIPLPFPSVQLKAQEMDFSHMMAPISMPQEMPIFQQNLEDKQPEISVVYEGKQKDSSKCLRKFAKKIFYLQRIVQDLTSERDKWKTEFEIVDKNHKELAMKFNENQEYYKLQDKKYSEMKIELEKYRTLAVSLEEEVNRLKHQNATETEVQIIEKIIEKPIEIIKHVILEKIIEKPIEIIRTIEAPPIEIEKIIEKIVEVPIERIVEKIVTVPHETIVEKIVEVPKIEIVERERIIEIPRPEYIEKIVYVDKPVYIEKPQIVKEVIETKDLAAEKELQHVREDYHRLQQIQEESSRELDEWRIRCLRFEDQFRTNEADRSVMFERDRAILVDEIKNNHQTIDDLRDRIEMLYKEITLLTDQNNRKNLEMTNQIRYLEEQISVYAPRVISTNTYQGMAAYQPPLPEQQSQHVQSTVYYMTQAPTLQYAQPPLNIPQTYSQPQYNQQQYQQQATSSQQQQQGNQSYNQSQQYQQTFQQNLQDTQDFNNNNQRYQQ